LAAGGRPISPTLRSEAALHPPRIQGVGGAELSHHARGASGRGICFKSFSGFMGPVVFLASPPVHWCWCAVGSCWIQASWIPCISFRFGCAKLWGQWQEIRPPWTIPFPSINQNVPSSVRKRITQAIAQHGVHQRSTIPSAPTWSTVLQLLRLSVVAWHTYCCI